MIPRIPSRNTSGPTIMVDRKDTNLISNRDQLSAVIFANEHNYFKLLEREKIR